MNIRKAEIEVCKTMTNDLMNAEYFINNMGVETRKPNNDDEFRSMKEIIKDIVTVCANNPSLLEDVSVFLAGNPTTSDESNEFLSKYNLCGILQRK